jgi:hypothetical protein
MTFNRNKKQGKQASKEETACNAVLIAALLPDEFYKRISNRHTLYNVSPG